MDLTPPDVTLPSCIRKAHATDNGRILALVDEKPMDAEGLVLGYRRSPDFFSLARARGGEETTLVIEHGDVSPLEGLGTFAFRWGYVGGRAVRVCYVCDLRIKSSARNMVAWRRAYESMLRGCTQPLPEAFCREFFTALFDDNAAAQRALVSPKRGGFRYTPLFPFHLVNVLAPTGFPVLPRRRDLDLVPLGRIPENAFVDFVSSAQKRKLFGQVFDGDEWRRRQRNWKGFSVDAGAAVLDSRGDLVATCIPWNPSEHRRVVVETLPQSLGIPFRCARAFMPRLRAALPVHGEFLAQRYLTHLEFREGLDAATARTCLQLFLHAFFGRDALERGVMCTFLDSRNETLSQGLRPGYLVQRTAATLYGVSLAEDSDLTNHLAREAQELSRSDLLGNATGFEPALA